MPQKSIYPVEKLIKIEQNENNFCEKKYMAIDFNEETENKRKDKLKYKRKIVCIEGNAKNELIVKDYHNEGLKEAFKKAKAEGREIYLVLYVKDYERERCRKEAEKILKDTFDLSDNRAKVNKLKEHFTKIWKNFRDFNGYAEMKRSYDEETGEHITDVLVGLTITYKTTLKDYEENKERFKGRTSELESILQEMKKAYEKATGEHKHLEVATFSPLAAAFDLCVSEFDAELERLRQEDDSAIQKEKCIVLRNEIELLQKEGIGAIPSGTLCTEDLVNKKNEINKEIASLLQMVKDLEEKVLTDQEIQGLREKFNHFQEQFVYLKAEIENLAKTQEKNIQSVQNMSVETNSLCNELGALLSEIENHKTAGTKTEVREKLINKIKDILSILRQPHETSSAGLNAAIAVINEAKNFIEENSKKANIYTGGPVGRLFGKGYSVLGKLMDKLRILLDTFLNVLSTINQNHEKCGNACFVSSK